MSGRAGVGLADLTFPDVFLLFDWTRVLSFFGCCVLFSGSLVFFIRSIILRFRLEALPDVGLSQATEIPESTSVSGNEKMSSGGFLAWDVLVMPANDLLRAAFLSVLGETDGDDEPPSFALAPARGARTLAGSEADLEGIFLGRSSGRPPETLVFFSTLLIGPFEAPSESEGLSFIFVNSDVEGIDVAPSTCEDDARSAGLIWPFELDLGGSSVVITALPVRLVTFIDSAFLTPRRVLAPGPLKKKELV